MENFIKKYELYIWVYFKRGPKMKIENFIGTKSWRKILEWLKQKVDIFIGTKNIFNPYINELLKPYKTYKIKCF